MRITIYNPYRIKHFSEKEDNLYLEGIFKITEILWEIPSLEEVIGHA